jgi:hypothetical protein
VALSDEALARKASLVDAYPEIAETLGKLSGLSPAETPHHGERAKLDVQLAMLAADTAITAASAADRQATRLVAATRVLAVATVALVAVTAALIFVTAAHGG